MPYQVLTYFETAESKWYDLKKQIQNKQYYCGPRNSQIDDWIDHNSTEVGLIFFFFPIQGKQMVLALLAIHSEGNKIGPVLYSVKKFHIG